MLTCRILMAHLLLCGGMLAAQEPPPAAEPSGPATRQNLTQEQQAILKDYEGFEKRLAELGEALRGSDLDRANLLIEARSESQRNQVQSRLNEIVAILNQPQGSYADAVDRQQAVVSQLEALLKILQTDAERDRLQARIKELEEVLKETNRVIAAQKDVRADTERGGELDKLQGDEERVAKSAQNLADKIAGQDARRAAEAGGPAEEPGGEPSDSGEPGKPQDDAPMQNPDQPAAEQPEAGTSEPRAPPPESQGQPSEGEPSKGTPSKGTPSEGTPSEGTPPEGKPPQGEPSQGEQGSRQPGEQNQQQSQQTPGREELEQAQKEMQQAIDELKKQNRDRASDEQDQAIAQLEAMKAEIEEILRQLRSEEREMYLTMLEARFQDMLQLQLRINAETVRLATREASERGEAHFTKSRGLSQDEQKNVLAADKALALLKEEGSSVAFPEAVDQMKSNMQSVAARLGKGDVDGTTQLLEKLIVESLEEMVLSLQKELEKLKEEQQQGQPQEGQQQDPQLVDTLAELKMVRSLQNQVNRLTKQVGQEIDGEQAEEADTLQLLQDLSRRQQRIQEATYDLSTGRNK